MFDTLISVRNPESTKERKKLGRNFFFGGKYKIGLNLIN